MYKDYGIYAKNSSGIYRITNTSNGRFYIGFTYNFQIRWNKHSSDLKRNKHPNAFLQNDYNVCGDDAFSLSVIEVVETIDNDSRVLLEQQYLDLYHDNKVVCYNIQKKVIPDPTTYSHNPKVTSQRNSRPMPQHTKEALLKANIGRKLSEEHKQKLRLAKLDKKQSLEHREKSIRNLRKRKSWQTTQETKIKSHLPNVVRNIHKKPKTKLVKLIKKDGQNEKVALINLVHSSEASQYAMAA